MIYILLGAAGVPVFSGFKGGIGVLAGPTGGYIAGFIFSALLYRLITGFKGKQEKPNVFAAFAGLAVCYLCGTLRFISLTSKTASAALSVCVLPFIPFDIIKILLAKLLSLRISKAIKWQG